MEKMEVMARAWIECDPNRDATPGSGYGPDDPIEDRGTDLDGKPRWQWFMPRAEATEAFLRRHGYAIVPAAVAERAGL